jgi:hypothetical protein
MCLEEPLHHVYCADDIMLLSLCHHWLSFSSRLALSFISLLLRRRTITTCRDYSKSWPISGCVQKADCDSPGYANQATCCAAHYGGQTGGACSNVIATTNQNAGKFYADYSTPWPIAGCKNTLPQPIYAAVFYATQLVLQKCFWRTDKWRMHYGTSILSNFKAYPIPDIEAHCSSHFRSHGKAYCSSHFHSYGKAYCSSH